MKRSTILFFILVALVNLVYWYFSPLQAEQGLVYSVDLCIRIAPIFVIVYILMVFFDYALDAKYIKTHVGKTSGLKGALISAGFGILSSGPIYVWYPLLSELQKKGMKTGHIAIFLYNRAIKLPLLPIFISYFGVLYSLTILVSVFLASLLNGFIVEQLVEGRK